MYSDKTENRDTIFECDIRNPDSFSDLREWLPFFELLKPEISYPKGARLFTEGQNPKGVYLINKGRIKLSACSQDGRVIIFDVAKAGEMLGISSTVSGSPHIATAEAVEQCRVSFIGKRKFLDFLEKSSEFALFAVKQLSRDYRAACHHICSLGLSASAADKLAALLAGWCNADKLNAGGTCYRLRISYTHEEIAQMIGTSRETVTRILRSFSDRNLIIRNGSEITVPNKKLLEAVIGTRSNLNGR